MGRWAPPELVEAALSGSEVAAEELVAAVWPGCFRLAASVIGDRNLAQDAAQEACVIVHRKIRTLRNVEAFDGWLYRVVMRESTHVRRRNPSHDQAVFDQNLGGDDTSVMDVWSAVAELPPELRDVTVLFYFDDLKSIDIASILGVAHATVRTRLARARERLRGLLDDYVDDARPTHKEITQHAI